VDKAKTRRPSTASLGQERASSAGVPQGNLGERIESTWLGEEFLSGEFVDIHDVLGAIRGLTRPCLISLEQGRDQFRIVVCKGAFIYAEGIQNGRELVGNEACVALSEITRTAPQAGRVRCKVYLMDEDEAIREFMGRPRLRVPLHLLNLSELSTYVDGNKALFLLLESKDTRVFVISKGDGSGSTFWLRGNLKSLIEGREIMISLADLTTPDRYVGQEDNPIAKMVQDLEANAKFSQNVERDFALNYFELVKNRSKLATTGSRAKL
jgi:hypothetical protein